MTTPSNPCLPPGEENKPGDDKPARPDPPPAESFGMSERGLGVFVLAGGCFVSYLGIIAPISESPCNQNFAP